MAATTRLRKGDRVRVIAGKHKGLEGEILSVRRDTGRVLVEGVNVIKKAQRPTQENPRGGFREQEAPIHVSNVQVLDPQTGEPTRIRVRTGEDGRKERIAAKSGVPLDD
jgi:large subunit ribosomal protein L24